MIDRASPPSGILRLFLRSPIWLYRWHAGWLLGGRFLMLEHRGRRSGDLHRAVIEVIGRRREIKAYYVAAAWAPRADWYQNVLKDPQVRVTVGGRSFPALARALPPEESRAFLEDYRRNHRLAAKALSRVLGVTQDELLETQVVEFRRVSGATTSAS